MQKCIILMWNKQDRRRGGGKKGERRGEKKRERKKAGNAKNKKSEIGKRKNGGKVPFFGEIGRHDKKERMEGRGSFLRGMAGGKGSLKMSFCSVQGKNQRKEGKNEQKRREKKKRKNKK